MKKRVVPLIKKCLKDYWDIAIIIVAIISIIFLTVFKVIDIAKCISTIVGLFAALVIAVIKTLKNNEQLMLISLTINYIMKKNGANIDELLGILIGGVW